MSFDMRTPLARWLEKKLGVDDGDIVVIDFTEDKVQHGYCETCYYEDWEVEIDYSFKNEKVKTYNYDGKLSRLISELEEANA